MFLQRTVVAFMAIYLVEVAVASEGRGRPRRLQPQEDPVSEKLVSMSPTASSVTSNDGSADLELGIESTPRAPRWLKPGKMTRQVYAEPINQIVSHLPVNGLLSFL